MDIWEENQNLLLRLLTSPNGESKTLEVELFTWEKLDMIDKIKLKLKL